MKLYLTESDIKHMILTVAKMYLNEDDSFKVKTDDDQDVTVHYEIGFVNKFYTLWKVLVGKFKTSYIFVKNISFSKEKAFSLYPDAIFNKELCGKKQSFYKYQDNLNAEYREKFFNTYTEVEIGAPIKLNNFLVTDVEAKVTKYDKPYYAITGIDYSTQNELYVISVFAAPKELPYKGDLLKVEGKIGLYAQKTDTIYINNAIYSFIDRTKTKVISEPIEGEKINKTMILTQFNYPTYYDKYKNELKTNGFVILTDDDGNDYIIETVVSDFRTGKPKTKFDMDSMNVGDVYNVKGTVKNVNGFRRLTYAKLTLISSAEQNEQPEQQKKIRTIIISENGTSGRKQIFSNRYRVDPQSIDALSNYIAEIFEKYDVQPDNRIIRCSHHYCTPDKLEETLLKDDDCTSIEVSFYVKPKTPNEKPLDYRLYGTIYYY